jgi:2,3-bisphosphoglycerate-dependent phosphoglycerate mutase
MSARNVAKDGAIFLTKEARVKVKGISDPATPLTNEGWQQARATGAALRSQYGVPDRIYHSGYQRTIETANGILEAYDEHERGSIDIRSHIFLRERDTGYTFEMTAEESAAAFPWLEAYWQTYGNFYARPPGGESWAEVTQRVYLFLDMLYRDACLIAANNNSSREARLIAGKTVFVVTHGGTLRCFRFLLESWSLEQINVAKAPRNCGLLVYRYNNDAHKLVLELDDTAPNEGVCPVGERSDVPR